MPVTATARHQRPGIVVHTSGTIRRTDVRTQLDISATSPARTILDCAPDLGPDRTARAIDDARLAGLLRLPELDGWRFHQGRLGFESDRSRDAIPLAAGFVTYRLTWRRLLDTPELEAQRLRAVLDQRSEAKG